MPLLREMSACWLMLVHNPATGELEDLHWPVAGRASVHEIEAVRWGMFATNPLRNPPEAWIHDEPCLVLVCRGCGGRLGGGDHFAEPEHAWLAGEGDGWLGDLCGACQPSRRPA